MKTDDSKPEREARSWYKKGCAFSEAGKYPQAVAAFTAAIDGHQGWAEAYFKRGVCHFLLGHCRRADQDLQAASLLGCQAALLWSRYDLERGDAP
ncbi:MAG: tetratricopeptide repeat protein [Desulfobacterales bacterium]